jgi:HAD superfamily hydrolase (TIGR01509 family)
MHSDTPKVRAFLFDADGVLYYRPRRGRFLAAFLQELGLMVPDERVLRAIRDALKAQSFRGTITRDEYFDRQLRALGVLDDTDVARGHEVLSREAGAIRLHEGVLPTLHELKRRGFMLGIVTNTAHPTEVKLAWLRREGVGGDVFDAVASSCEVGISKPEPGIYEAALAQLEVAAADAAFVGHATDELEGARAVGLVTVAYNFEPSAEADYYVQDFSDLLELPIAIAPTG